MFGSSCSIRHFTFFLNPTVFNWNQLPGIQNQREVCQQWTMWVIRDTLVNTSHCVCTLTLLFHSIYFKQEKRPIFLFSLKYIFRLLQYKLCLLFLEAAFAGFYPCFSLFHECLCSFVLAFRSSRKTKADNSPCLLNLEICSLGQLLSLSPYMSESML